MMIRSNQNGDTIVEVLIALVIIGSVLTGAFSISNLSLRQIRMSQERTEGQKVAQSVVESLNAMYESKPGTVDRVDPTSATEGLFCILSAPNQIIPTSAFQPTTDQPSTCRAGTDNRYHIAIISQGASTKIFKVTVSWQAVSGRGEKLEIYYRVREPET